MRRGLRRRGVWGCRCSPASTFKAKKRRTESSHSVASTLNSCGTHLVHFVREKHEAVLVAKLKHSTKVVGGQTCTSRVSLRMRRIRGEVEEEQGEGNFTQSYCSLNSLSLFHSLTLTH